MARPFRAGDRVLLVDAKRRRHLVTLTAGGQFHTHTGVLEHDALIGQREGITVRTTLGARLTAVRPTLGEYVLEMPRGAQVIYPKDLGPIMILADVFPGAEVLESGVGSGALTLALLRAVGAHGHVTGYEIRDDFARRARANVEGFLGPDVPLDVEVRDVYAGIDPPPDRGDVAATDDTPPAGGKPGFDRILLDLPEPWRVVKHAEEALHPGGILLAYLPTIGQVSRLREELTGSAFGMVESLEVLQRTWHVDGQSVRPDHRMVAHTGFLTHARLLTPGGT
jgi:tRNA (adenine57-N1/adenine58-N1)-methyltransferase catalytic subunit